MDYFRQFMCIALCTSIVTTSCHALLDRPPEEKFPEHLLPHLWNSADVGQNASCDFESPCFWTLSNHSTGGDWHIASPEQSRVSAQAAWPATDHSVGDTDGHFLLLSAAAAEAAGSCEFSITGPALSNSGPLCQLQLALFQPEHSRGNLSVRVKLLESASAIGSPALSNLGQDITREQWEVLEAQIGQMEEPFQVTLVFTTCGEEEEGGGTLAIDSLELKNCNMGKSQELEMKNTVLNQILKSFGGLLDIS